MLLSSGKENPVISLSIDTAPAEVCFMDEQVKSLGPLASCGPLEQLLQTQQDWEALCALKLPCTLAGLVRRVVYILYGNT